MSTDTNAGVQEGTDGVEREDYDAMLDTLGVEIEEAQYKIENRRVQSQKNGKVRVKHHWYDGTTSVIERRPSLSV